MGLRLELDYWKSLVFKQRYQKYPFFVPYDFDDGSSGNESDDEWKDSKTAD